jgi:hypothetical protein
MSTWNKVKTPAIVFSVVMGIMWIDAYPQKNWFGKLKTDAARNGILVISGTELRTGEFYNPFLWKSYIKQAWLIQDHYSKADLSIRQPIGVRIFFKRLDGEDHTFWMLFSSDRRASKIVSTESDRDGDILSAQCSVETILAEGEVPNDGWHKREP